VVRRRSVGGPDALRGARDLVVEHPWDRRNVARCRELRPRVDRAVTPTQHPAKPRKRRAKVAERVASDLLAQICDERLPEGEVLAREREMTATFGVARGTMREALRLLEMHGALAIRSGPDGGPIVRQP